MSRISLRLAVPVTFAARTLYSINGNGQQEAAAAILFPQFIEVPQTNIIFALGCFFTLVRGFISGNFLVFKTLPDSLQTYPRSLILVGSFIREFLVLTVPIIPERAIISTSSDIFSGTKPS